MDEFEGRIGITDKGGKRFGNLVVMIDPAGEITFDFEPIPAEELFKPPEEVPSE